MHPCNFRFLLTLLFLSALSVIPVRAGTVSGTVSVQKAKVLVIGPKSQKDVVVFLEPQTAGTHSPPAEHAEMDQKGLVFIPHVMAVQKGTPVDFLNSDNDRHNVFFLFEKSGAILDIGTWGPGESVTYTFDDTGPLVALCQLHLEMAAHILVFDHPFYQVVELDEQTQSTSFRITGVPEGRYLLNVWHKKLKKKGAPEEITVVKSSEVQVDVIITKSKYAK